MSTYVICPCCGEKLLVALNLEENDWTPEHRPNAYWDKIKNEWVDVKKTRM